MKKQRSPALWLLMIPAQLVLGGLFSLLGVWIDSRIFSGGGQGHGVPIFSVLFPIIAVVSQIVRERDLSDYLKSDPETYMAPDVLLPALCLLFFAVWIMGVISSALATRMEIVGNLMVCLLLFLTGMVLHYFAAKAFGTGSAGALLCTSLVPNWQSFWMADVLANRSHIPASYFIWTLIYSVLYCAAWIGWAFFLFQDSELARDTR